jgi:hypothetical protein
LLVAANPLLHVAISHRLGSVVGTLHSPKAAVRSTRRVPSQLQQCFNLSLPALCGRELAVRRGLPQPRKSGLKPLRPLLVA